MLQVSKRVEYERKFFILLTGALIALAWLALWAWGQSPYGRFLSHEHLDEVSLGNTPVLLVFVAGWTVMCAAMMMLMFAVGAGNLGWMLILGAIMAVEKNAPKRPTGVNFRGS